MSPRAPDVMDALQQAARLDDDEAFDAAFGDLLDRAQSHANPDPPLRAFVAQRMGAKLGPLRESMQPSRSDAPEFAAASGRERAGRSVVRTSRWGKNGRGVALLAAGVAIGFVLGRTPDWSQDRTAAPDAREHEPSSATSSVAASAQRMQAPGPGPAPREAEPSTAPRAHAPSSLEQGRDAEPIRDAEPKASLRREPSSVRRQQPRSNADAASLRFALEQLRKAQLFLRAHEPARALGALDALDARVPASVLQEEREVTRTLAWCDSGQVAKASTLARRVLERAPDSAYAASLQESCAGANALPRAGVSNPELFQQMRERTSNPER
jgi:hypothetical protein